MKLLALWLLTVLLIPGVMLIAGYYYRSHVPKSMKSGYRTRRSMKSKETWAFAHKLLGRYWRLLGWPTLIVSLAAIAVFFGKDEDTVGAALGVLSALQCVPLIVPMVLVERALKTHFDENGLPYDPVDWLEE